MSPEHSQQYWGAMPGFSPEWREWDGEVVVFDNYSGDTHTFDAITAFVLQSLSEQSQNLEALNQCVADEFGLQPDSELLSYLQKALDKLASLSLVVRLQ